MKFIHVVLLALFSACTSPAMNPSREPSQSSVPRFSEVVKKTPESAKYCPAASDGETCLMTWSEARLFCESQNSHLPTAREYADLIKPRGTRVLETDEVSGGVPPGFYLVASKNPDGSFDSFYMNHTAYRRPERETESHLLWTASIPPQHPEYAHVYYDQWGGGGGDPKDHLLTHRNAVQCVPNE